MQRQGPVRAIVLKERMTPGHDPLAQRLRAVFVVKNTVMPMHASGSLFPSESGVLC